MMAKLNFLIKRGKIINTLKVERIIIFTQEESFVAKCDYTSLETAKNLYL